MAETTGIEWTDKTWSPWTGCQAASLACDFCYAQELDTRYGKGDRWGPHGIRQRTAESYWHRAHQWSRSAALNGTRIKVFPSMCDPFDNHPSIQPEWRTGFWDVIRNTPNLDWQLLTKRPSNIAKMLPPDWGSGWPNVWLGVTAENQEEAERRIPHLCRVPAARHFLSCEPLLGPIDLRKACTYLDRDWGMVPIDWVIAGGESGNQARPSHPDWFRSLRDQCAPAGVPFFFKQWGEWLPGTQYNDACRLADPCDTESRFACMDWDGSKYDDASSFWADEPSELAVFRVGKKRAGSLLDGVEHKAFPPDVQTCLQ